MTMLTRWDPWREMNRAQEEMGRLLEDRFVFRAGESLGWTRPLPELFRASGLKFDFSEKTIGPLIKAALSDLEKLDG